MRPQTHVPLQSAKVAGIVGFPLLALSYSWLPATITGYDVPSLSYLIILGEAGAFLAGALALTIGMLLRRRFDPGSSNDRTAQLTRILGALLIFLVLVPNLVGALLD